MFETE